MQDFDNHGFLLYYAIDSDCGSDNQSMVYLKITLLLAERKELEYWKQNSELQYYCYI